MKRLSALVAVAVLVACTSEGAPAASPSVGPPGAEACPVFPADNVWHANVSTLPVHSRSAAWIASMGGGTRKLHPDFGPSGESMPYGLPYEVVPGNHAKVSVSFLYDDESDPGPYPFDADTPIELGEGDEHAIMLDKDNCKLYELYDAHFAPNNGSDAGSGAVFDLRSNALRPAGWTSADAAGLPIFAGLVRLDEVQRGVIDHAIRVTASRTDRSYVWPARHQAGAASDPNLPPMGARFRMKSTFNISSYRADTQVILRAFKAYGMMVADNGSDWFFQGSAEDGWNTDLLDELKSIPASAFEAVDTSSIMVTPNSGQFKTSTPVSTVAVRDFSYSPANSSVSRGTVLTWRFDGPSSHTVDDTSGMTAYASGNRSPGATFSRAFNGAGSYPFGCALHPSMKGTVKVPISASPGTGGTSSSFAVTWASAIPPTGYVYDVQIWRPGASFFAMWKAGSRAVSSSFVPDAGAGTYQFRARLKRTSNGKFSGYSAAAAITVS